MGFGAKSNLGILSGHMFSSSENVFNVQDISWGYFAITAFMGLVAAFDLNIPTAVLLVLSLWIFSVLLQKSLIQPSYGIIALTAFIPYSKAIAGNLGGLIPGMNFTTVLTLITLIGFFSNSNKIQKYEVLPQEAKFRWNVILFCLFAALAIFHTEMAYGSASVFAGLVEFKRWFDPLMVFFLTSYLVQEEEDARKILYMMAFTLVVVGFGTFWQRHELDNHSNYVRLTGIAGQANTMGAFYANYVFIMLGFFFMKGMKLIRRGFFFIGIVGCLLGLFATQSRGDALGVVGGMLVFFFLRNKLQFVMLVALLTFVATNPQFLPGGLKQRVQRTIQHQSSDGFGEKTRLDASARERLALWKGAIRMIEANPVFGVGYHMFHHYIYSYADHDADTESLSLKNRDGHNAYLMIGSEMGLPALITFIVILVSMLRIAWRSYKESFDRYWKIVSLVALCSITSLMITNMFGSRVFSLVLTGYLWMVIAILLKMPRWAAQRRENNLTVGMDNKFVHKNHPAFSRS
jgi:O-antigen ligase